MFYEELKEKRESLGLSLKQISTKTKINLKFLTAFETGEFTNLPKTYIRLFLKTYANELGLDSNKILNQFNEHIEDQDIKSINPKSNYSKSGKDIKLESEKKINFPLFILIIAVSVFIIIILKQISNESPLESSTTPIGGSEDISLSSEDSKITEDIKEQVIDTLTIDESKPMIAELDTTTIPEPIIVQNDLTLLLKTIDSCWVQIILDKTDTSEAIFLPNARKSWKAKEEFNIMIGRPTKVALSLNGNDLGIIASEGKPVRLYITSEGIINRRVY